MKRVSLTIDGKKITAEEGDNLLYVALANGIYIPNLCAMKELSPQPASCRLCFVGISGRESPVAACTGEVTEGLIVDTQEPAARRLATTSFELIMASHPVDCAHCARNGFCELQKIAAHLKVKLNTKRFRKLVRGLPVDDSHPRITYDPNKCVLCGRCVRVCREQVKEPALGFAYRGFKRVVTTFGGEPLANYRCQACDACASVCPVGALVLKKGLKEPVMV
jgi:bidirectional [NiFe] hydrogenase diaphorase subunit